jgi:ribonuclease BN (tRNA processing enzyme)
VKITLVPSSVSAPAAAPNHYLISYVINDSVAIDAGCVGFCGPPQQQAPIKHMFLSHTHIDHVASLPLFLENVYQAGGEPVTVYGSADVLDCLRRDLFNDRVWPDFVALSQGRPGFLRLETLEDGKSVTVGGLRLTPCAVNHVVPTFGFLVEDEGAAVLIPSDTGPTEVIWQRANRTPNLKAVFLEASFPDALGWLAEEAKHLTPRTFALEAQKLQRPALLVAVHVKPRYYAEVAAELQALRLPGLEMARYGHTYHF